MCVCITVGQLKTKSNVNGLVFCAWFGFFGFRTRVNIVFSSQVRISGSQIFLSVHPEDVRLYVDLLAREWNGASLVGFHEDAEGVEGKLQLRAYADENWAALEAKKKDLKNNINRMLSKKLGFLLFNSGWKCPKYGHKYKPFPNISEYLVNVFWKTLSRLQFTSCIHNVMK